MIDRELPDCAQRARAQVSQRGFWRSATGWPGLSEACLMVRRTQ
jgi:hypothetical protein